MELLAYLIRSLTMLMITWLALRFIGKKSIAQMTSYELAGVMLLTTMAAEPMAVKVVSKVSAGVLFIAVIVVLMGLLSLKRAFYNMDMKPDIVIRRGKIDRDALHHNQMNTSLLLSMLRLKGYPRISEIEYAIIEPNGQVSVLPKSTCRPLQPQDMQISPAYEGLPLPLILDGEIQYNNLRYAGLTVEWLRSELLKAGVTRAEDVMLAQVNARSELYLSRYDEPEGPRPPMV